jgi:copper chaperone CopZ
MATPLKLVIEGMHCGGCVTRVTNALGKVEGVEVRKVEAGSAEVVFDETKVQPSDVANAVNRIGFNAREA